MKRIRRRTTLLELVKAVQDQTASDAEVVAVIRFLINSGLVILSGTFAGSHL